MNQVKFIMTLWPVLIVAALMAGPLDAADISGKKACRLVDVDAWHDEEKSLAGKELIAFASWCSSCKEKLLSTKSAPENFVLVSVFEEPEQSARAIARLGLTSACVYGRELSVRLGIKELPWSKKL